MSFEEYWKNLVAKNPHMADGDTVVRITVASFKKSIQQAFEIGAMTAQPPEPPQPAKRHSPDSIFGTIFGTIFGD